MNKKKEFDCVEFQRKTREQFVNEADSNFENLVKILDDKIKDSDVYWKLKNRLSKENELVTA